ncbi:ribosome biogenesis GTPase Der [Atopobium sp. oral taxon 416]|uniref:ribosome biogenesis GTPase Der n=1 Tax=Atopobium sp. oral taxon 416 TaxID=712157 RepID=UPI001BA58C4F|nr:ribosome biogenesis GTPase Der [Atopobium sp. oral taxon 416]QUC02203.1 ribosome biogenesis GTPase Der [Atopobium sp. oral taxon 416]
MPLPMVAIVGRPNVGKSTLVNRLSQTKDAIVHESRGVTRDRSYHFCDWNGRQFTLIDTGGVEVQKSGNVFASSIREQVIAACKEAQVIIFLVDATCSVSEEDEEVARIVRRSPKPIFLVANKCDNPAREPDLWEFDALGVGQARAISANHGYGTGDLLDDIVAVLPAEMTGNDEDDVDTLNIAVVGRPNVGKSSLTNDLLGKRRSIVSDVAGTTRDAIDTVFERDGQLYRLVDTAGIRKKNTVHEDIEYYSMIRGLEAMDRADVVLLVIDSVDGVTEQDQKIAEMAIDRGCGMVILLNKWDLVRDSQARQEVTRSVQKRLSFAQWAETLRISAKTGRGVDKVLDLANKAARARDITISTAHLNRAMIEIRKSGYTVVKKNKRLKVNYITQTGHRPPVFTIFCNMPELVSDNYRRFIENRLRGAFDLKGTPIRLRFRRKDMRL